MSLFRLRIYQALAGSPPSDPSKILLALALSYTGPALTVVSVRLGSWPLDDAAVSAVAESLPGTLMGRVRVDAKLSLSPGMETGCVLIETGGVARLVWVNWDSASSFALWGPRSFSFPRSELTL